MSMDAGSLAQMTYAANNNATQSPFSSGALGTPGAGFGARGARANPKRLSVALPPKVASINENQVDNPTPRTSRSHLLAGLRTQPKTPAVPASAPYNQTQHQPQGLHASQWADQSYYGQPPQQLNTAAASHGQAHPYAMSAGHQMYSLPEQVLAPPSLYEQAEEMDPMMLQQMQVQSLFLAQRQQQLQQQLAHLTAAAQGMNLNGHMQRSQFQQFPMTPQTPQHLFMLQQQQQQQQQAQQAQQLPAPIEVPGQPGVYLVFNPATQSYTYAVDQALQQSQQILSPVQQTHLGAHQQPAKVESPPPVNFNHAAPSSERSTFAGGRSFTPPKKAPSPPSTLEHVEPLPAPSATAFRRGHKKATSLAISASSGVADGPKTSSLATMGSQRHAFPPTPMTGTFGPGAARAGEHPMRQPRGPPPLEELTAAPTSIHEGSKNFATRQRRRALDNLMRAGTVRRGVSRSSGGSPVSDGGYPFPIGEEAAGSAAVSANSSRKMSPIGSEMKQKRGSQGSADGYFGLSSASSSEGEDAGAFNLPPTPATPTAFGERKKLMLGVLNAAEKRKSYAV